MNNYLYISIDIETDGTVPGISSMLSLGAIAYNYKGKELGVFDQNLLPLDHCRPDPLTMRDFWDKQPPEVWTRATENAQNAFEVMTDFGSWIQMIATATDSNPRPMAVCWPATFDFAFINYYFHWCIGYNPLGFAAIDIKSLWWGAGEPFPIQLDNPHIAVEDARNQGRLFFKIIDYIKRNKQRLATIEAM